MKIAAKETEHWLVFRERSPHLPEPGKLTKEIISIKKILTSIISTSKKRL